LGQDVNMEKPRKVTKRPSWHHQLAAAITELSWFVLWPPGLEPRAWRVNGRGRSGLVDVMADMVPLLPIEGPSNKPHLPVSATSNPPTSI